MSETANEHHVDRDRVAVAYGIPDEMRDGFMTGSTAEELRDQAVRLRESFTPLCGPKTYRAAAFDGYDQYFDESGQRRAWT